MKYLFLFLISLNVFAGAFAPLEKSGFDEKTFPKFYEHEKECEEIEGNACYDISICPTHECELVAEIVNGKPIYGKKENVVECATKEACDLLKPDHCLNFTDHEFFYAENLIFSGYKAYCTKLTGYEQVNTGKKILVNSPVKKAAYEAKIAKEKKDKEDEKAANLAKKVKAKADMNAASNVALLKKAMLDYLDAVEKE